MVIHGDLKYSSLREMCESTIIVVGHWKHLKNCWLVPG